MKLKNLFYLLLALPLLAVACTKSTTSTEEPKPGPDPQPENPKGELTVVESSIEVAFYGGEGEINYSITDGAEGAMPEVTPNANWVTNVEVGSTITFTVEFNSTTEERLAIVAVKYGETSKEVFVRQAAGYEIDVEFEATALNGEYYGTKYSQDPNYFAILSKNGTTGWSDLYIDTYYRFDLYSTTTTDASAPVLPHGVFAFDYYDQGLGGTFAHPRSVLIETFENGNLVESQIEDGVLFITDNKIEAYIKFVNGKVHHVVYEGPLGLGYIPLEEPDYYSTLTDDHIFNHPDGTIRLNYLGDYYGIGAANWTVSMVLPGQNINGDYFIIDIVTDSVEFNASNIVGTYNCVAEADVAKDTFIAGYYNNGFGSSWYFVAVDNYYGTDDVAPIVDGTITIAEEGTKFVVTFDCMDDNGHKIAGTFTCSGLEMYDNSNY